MVMVAMGDSLASDCNDCIVVTCERRQQATYAAVKDAEINTTEMLKQQAAYAAVKPDLTGGMTFAELLFQQ